MQITYESNNRDLIIRLSGELDHHAAREAMRTIDQWIEQAIPSKTILDLGGLTFMDSSGIAVVIRTKRRMDAVGGTLMVVNIPRQAARVLDAAGLGRYIDFT